MLPYLSLTCTHLPPSLPYTLHCALPPPHPSFPLTPSLNSLYIVPLARPHSSPSSPLSPVPLPPSPYPGLGSLPSEAAMIYLHPEAEERRYIQRRIATNPMWTLDRGTGWYVQERLNKKKASLLGSGK